MIRSKSFYNQFHLIVLLLTECFKLLLQCYLLLTVNSCNKGNIILSWNCYKWSTVKRLHFETSFPPMERGKLWQTTALQFIVLSCWSVCRLFNFSNKPTSVTTRRARDSCKRFYPNVAEDITFAYTFMVQWYLITFSLINFITKTLG